MFFAKSAVFGGTPTAIMPLQLEAAPVELQIDQYLTAWTEPAGLLLASYGKI